VTPQVTLELGREEVDGFVELAKLGDEDIVEDGGWATTARLALPAIPIPVKALMIPTTVPKRPTKGAALPTVARKESRLSSRSVSWEAAQAMWRERVWH
jgi:hypothetical protein